MARPPRTPIAVQVQACEAKSPILHIAEEMGLYLFVLQ